MWSYFLDDVIKMRAPKFWTFRSLEIFFLDVLHHTQEQQKSLHNTRASMCVVRVFLSDAYFMRLIWLCLAIHLETVCYMFTANSLAVGTGKSSLPRSDTLKLLGSFSSIQILVTQTCRDLSKDCFNNTGQQYFLGLLKAGPQRSQPPFMEMLHIVRIVHLQLQRVLIGSHLRFISEQIHT